MIHDYDIYECKKQDYLYILAVSTLTCLLISYLFYQNLFISLFLSPYGFFYAKSYKKKQTQKRKRELNYQFRDAISGISAALEAGYSVENAIKSAAVDLEAIYNKEALILVEFRRMIAMIQNNTPVHEAMEEFASRSKVEDILCFSEVFQTAKRSGGDMVQIIRATSKTITEKIEIYREIETLITAKKLETQIMKGMPFVIIIYFTLCNPGFLQPLYHNLFGIAFMTIMLLLTLAFSKLSDAIIKIEV